MKHTKVALIDLGDTRNEYNEPIGIECIANGLRGLDNISCNLIWCDKNSSLDYEYLSTFDIVGVSIGIGMLESFDSLYNGISSYKRNQNIIVGGSIPTFAYKELLKTYNDIICSVGEGEITFRQLVMHFQKNGSFDRSLFSTIPNLSYIFIQELKSTRREVVDLSVISPMHRDKNILETVKKKAGIIRIEGSRGCSWGMCSFCCIKPKYGNSKWRGFPISKILSELVELSNCGFTSPYFTDEDFFGQDYERIITLAESIIEMKNKGIICQEMNFFISIMASDLKSIQGQEALKIFKEAGLREVFLGIESLEDSQIKRYKKKANEDININAINFIASLELQLDTGFILFDPDMTFEELKRSLKYIESIQLHKYDSRSLKRLRLQPLTEVTYQYLQANNATLDVNQLEYPYSFSDRNVQEVYDKYSEWEDAEKIKVWKLQSISRGEISEIERLAFKQMLSYLREIDFNVLKSIIEYVKGNISRLEYISQYEVFSMKRQKFFENDGSFIK